MPDDDTDTSAALEQAIRHHVATTADGAYLTDWIVFAAAAMPDDADSTTYVTETSSAPLHHRIGLVRYLALRTDALVTDRDP